MAKIKTIDVEKYMEKNYSSNIFTLIGEEQEDVRQAKKLASDVELLTEVMASLKEQAEEHHYLVDEAILTCTRCKEESDDSYGESFCVPKGISERKLVVTQNSTAKNGAGQCFATVNDSEKNVNIFPFGNCKNPPDRDKEREALLYASENEELRKLGTCFYLMNLNDQWENLISDTGYEKIPGEDGKLLETITMEAILFCKHGGFIYPRHSGYIETDVEEEEEVLEEENDMQQYIKSILEALGWTTDFQELREIEAILKDFNITDRNSIACFLLLCITESGPEGTYSGKEDLKGNECVDKYGRAVTEFYDQVKKNYSYEERGVGYMQVTGCENQKACFEYLKEHGYYTGDIYPNAKGYVEELREMPWATSAWRWAIYQQPQGTHLNDYVQKKVEVNNGSLTSGIVLTAESFINGKVSNETNKGIKVGETVNERSNTMNNALSHIANGEIPSRDRDKENGWYVENDNLYVDGWKYSAPVNWNTFDNNYEILKKQGIIQ